MLSRRLVRIKCLQSVYAFRQSSNAKETDVTSHFIQNVEQLEKAYNLGLTFIKALDYFLLSEIDIEREKYFPSPESIRSYSLFSKNKLMPLFDAVDHKDAQKIWDTEGEALDLFLKEIKDKPFVRDYLVYDDPNFELSKNFTIKVIEYALSKSKIITDVLENAILSWQDDKHVVLRSLQNTLKNLKEEDTALKTYNFKRDATVEVQYGQSLCELAAKHQDEILKKVEIFSTNWDLERIAQTDQIIVLLAVIEFIYFKDIPVKVTMNEYLEVAKSHSTPQSSRFVNGILDQYKNVLLEEGKIEKKGKGLKER